MGDYFDSKETAKQDHKENLSEKLQNSKQNYSISRVSLIGL